MEDRGMGKIDKTFLVRKVFNFICENFLGQWCEIRSLGGGDEGGGVIFYLSISTKSNIYIVDVVVADVIRCCPASVAQQSGGMQSVIYADGCYHSHDHKIYVDFINKLKLKWWVKR